MLFKQKNMAFETKKKEDGKRALKKATSKIKKKNVGLERRAE
jgi:hypothetical protein